MQVTVYDQETTVNPKNPAFNYLTGFDNPYIEVKAVIKDSQKQWKETFKVTNMEAAEQEVREVIQFFNNTLRPYEKEREFVSLWIEDEEVSRYKDKEGMCGWLNPEGEFFPCGFGEHNLYALNVLQKYEDDLSIIAQNQHIPMSVDEQSSFSHIGIFGEITEKQLAWFNRFFDKLSSKQKGTVVKMLEEQGRKLDFEW